MTMLSKVQYKKLTCSLTTLRKKGLITFLPSLSFLNIIKIENCQTNVIGLEIRIGRGSQNILKIILELQQYLDLQIKEKPCITHAFHNCCLREKLSKIVPVKKCRVSSGRTP